MALTIVAGDAFASTAGIARGTERVEDGYSASSTNGGQKRKVISDHQGVLGGFFRASDGVTTGIFLKAADGTDVFLTWPSGSAVIGTTIP